MFTPSPITLTGDFVRLEPLTSDHLDALCTVGLDSALWRWSPRKPILTRDAMAAYVDEALAEQAAGRSVPFATVHRASNQVVGCTRFGNIVPAHKRVEIGWTWVARAWQRTAVNTEAKLLMLTHAFETWACNRVELKTDTLNTRSRNAMKRLGCQEEGILRQHVVVADGRLRDTVYYSLVAAEWPAAKERLRAKLAQHAE